MSVDGFLERLRREGHIVVVGASLAGLRAAETLRAKGFTGTLTMIGDEPHEPYDRPPLSKQVLLGRVPADHTLLPRRRELDAQWRLGTAAIALDVAAKRVHLADGDSVDYDRLLITTGVRARPWVHELEAELNGVFVLRTSDDAAQLHRRLSAGPRRVLVIGAAARASGTGPSGPAEGTGSARSPSTPRRTRAGSHGPQASTGRARRLRRHRLGGDHPEEPGAVHLVQ